MSNSVATPTSFGALLRALSCRGPPGQESGPTHIRDLSSSNHCRSTSRILRERMMFALTPDVFSKSSLRVSTVLTPFIDRNLCIVSLPSTDICVTRQREPITNHVVGYPLVPVDSLRVHEVLHQSRCTVVRQSVVSRQGVVYANNGRLWDYSIDLP